MASKTLIVLGVLFATAVLISSEVAAREVAERQEKKVVNQKYEHGGYNSSVVSGGDGYSGGDHGCHYGCCEWGCHGCCECCSTADEIPARPERMPKPNN